MTRPRSPADPPIEEPVALGAVPQILQPLAAREMRVGALPVSRALPTAGRRMVGPWCFLDRYGPLTFSDGRPMDVATHPHLGLQTVTWLVAGEVVHDDSLGLEALVRPGGVNVMSSGRGIAHAERTPSANSGRLHGVQLWTALPDAHRDDAPSFQHVEEVPQVDVRGGLIQVFSGTLLGATSPARHFSEIVGADLDVHRGASLTLPLEPRYEHALLVLAGQVDTAGQTVQPGVLYYLAPGHSEIGFSSREGGRMLIVGGAPFPEPILMWWNFVARSREEIATARADWEAGRRFGDVPVYDGPRMAAPALSRLAAPTPLS